MLGFFKVTGDSLLPEYLEGDFVLAVKIPFFLDTFQKGDVVLIRHPDYGVLIKYIEQVLPGGETYLVIGTHPLSIDSRTFGAVHKRNLIGKVIWHIRKPPQVHST